MILNDPAQFAMLHLEPSLTRGDEVVWHQVRRATRPVPPALPCLKCRRACSSDEALRLILENHTRVELNLPPHCAAKMLKEDVRCAPPL